MLKNVVKHFKLITKHKLIVFKLSIRAGIPFRGFMHDFSKYSFTEFWESAKYYQGNHSPISACKKDKGYSKAWLHHKGRNKHHSEYWYDPEAPDPTPLIPYKYTVEMICDKLSASMVYNGKNFTNSSELEYWNKEKERVRVNKNIEKLLDRVFLDISNEGINKVVTSKNLKKLYNEYCLKK